MYQDLCRFSDQRYGGQGWPSRRLQVCLKFRCLTEGVSEESTRSEIQRENGAA